MINYSNCLADVLQEPIFSFQITTNNIYPNLYFPLNKQSKQDDRARLDMDQTNR